MNILHKESKIASLHKKSVFSSFGNSEYRFLKDTKRFTIVVDTDLDKDQKISLLLTSFPLQFRDTVNILYKNVQNYLRGIKSKSQGLSIVVAGSSKKRWLHDYDKHTRKEKFNIIICIYHNEPGLAGLSLKNEKSQTKILLQTNEIEQMEKLIQTEFSYFTEKQKILHHQLKLKKRFGYNLDQEGSLYIFYLKEFENIKDFVKNYTMASSKFQKTLFYEFNTLADLRAYIKKIPNNNYHPKSVDYESVVSSQFSSENMMSNAKYRKAVDIQDKDKIIVMSNQQYGQKIEKLMSKYKNCIVYVLDQYHKDQFMKKICDLHHNHEYDRYLDLVHSISLQILIDSTTKSSQFNNEYAEFTHFQSLNQLYRLIEQIMSYHQILVYLNEQNYAEVVDYLQAKDIKNCKIYLKSSSEQGFRDKSPYLIGESHQTIHFIKFADNLKYDIQTYQDPLKILTGQKMQFLVLKDHKNIIDLVEETITDKVNLELVLLVDFEQHLNYLIQNSEPNIDYVIISQINNLKQLIGKVHENNRFKIILLHTGPDDEFDKFPEILVCVQNEDKLVEFIQSIQIRELENVDEDLDYIKESDKKVKQIKLTAVKSKEQELFNFTLGINRNKIIIRIPNSMNQKNSIIMEQRLKQRHRSNIEFKIYEETEKLRDVEFSDQPLSYIIANDQHLKWFERFLSNQKNQSFKVVLYTKELSRNRDKLKFNRIKLITDQFKDIEIYINEEYDKFVAERKDQKKRIYGEFILKSNEKIHIIAPHDDQFKKHLFETFSAEDIHLIEYNHIKQTKEQLQGQLFTQKAVVILKNYEAMMELKKIKYNIRQTRILILQKYQSNRPDNKNIFYLTSYDQVIAWIYEIPKQEDYRKKQLNISSLSLVDTEKNTRSNLMDEKFNAWHLEILKKQLKKIQSHEMLSLICYEQPYIVKQLKERQLPFIQIKNLLPQQNFEQVMEPIPKHKRTILLKNDHMILERPAEMFQKYPNMKVININDREMEELVLREIITNEQQIRKKGCLFIFIENKFKENVESLIKDLAIRQNYVVKRFEDEKELEQIYADFPEQQTCLIILKNDTSQSKIEYYRRFITQKTNIIIKNTSEETLSEIVFRNNLEFKQDPEPKFDILQNQELLNANNFYIYKNTNELGMQTSAVVTDDLNKYYLLPREMRYRREMKAIQKYKNQHLNITYFKQIIDLQKLLSDILKKNANPNNIFIVQSQQQQFEQSLMLLCKANPLVHHINYNQAVIGMRDNLDITMNVLHNLDKRYNRFIEQLHKHNITTEYFEDAEQLRTKIESSKTHKIILTQQYKSIEQIVLQNQDAKVLMVDVRQNPFPVKTNIRNRVRYISQEEIESNIREIYTKEVKQNKINVFYEQDNEKLEQILCKITLQGKNINKYNLLPFEDIEELQVLCTANEKEQAILVINQRFQKQVDALSRKYKFSKVILLSQYRQRGGKYLNLQEFDFEQELSQFLNLIQTNQKQSIEQILFEFVNRSLLTIGQDQQSKFFEELFQGTKINYSFCQFDPQNISQFIKEAEQKQIKQCILIIPEQNQHQIIKSLQNSPLRIVIIVRKDEEYNIKNQHIALTSYKLFTPQVIKKINSPYRISLIKNSTIFVNNSTFFSNLGRNNKFNFDIRFFDKKEDLQQMISNLPTNHEARILKQQEDKDQKYVLQKINTNPQIKIFYEQKETFVQQYITNIKKSDQNSLIQQFVFKSAIDLNNQLVNHKRNSINNHILISQKMLAQLKKVKQRHNQCKWIQIPNKQKVFNEKLFNQFADKKGNLYILVKGNVLKNLDLKFVKETGLNINVYQYTDFQEVQSYLTNIQNSKLLIFCEEGEEEMLSRMSNRNAFIFELDNQNQIQQADVCNFYLKKLIERVSKTKQKFKLSKIKSQVRELSQLREQSNIQNKDEKQVSTHTLNQMNQQVTQLSTHSIKLIEQNKQQHKSISLDLSSAEQQDMWIQNNYNVKPNEYVISTLPTIPTSPESNEYGTFKLEETTRKQTKYKQVSKIDSQHGIISMNMGYRSPRNYQNLSRRLFVETIMQNQRVFVLIDQTQYQILNLARTIQKNNERIKVIQYNKSNILSICSFIEQADSAVLITDITFQNEIDKVVRGKINFKVIVKCLSKPKNKQISIQKYYATTNKLIYEFILSIPKQNYMYSFKKSYKYLFKHKKSAIIFYYNSSALPYSIKLELFKLMVENDRVCVIAYESSIQFSGRPEDFYYIIANDYHKIQSEIEKLTNNAKVILIGEKNPSISKKIISIKNSKYLIKLLSDINFILQNENIEEKLFKKLENNSNKLNYYNQTEIDAQIKTYSHSRIKSINSRSRVSLFNDIYTPKNYPSHRTFTQSEQSQKKQYKPVLEDKNNRIQIKKKILESMKKHKKLLIFIPQNYTIQSSKFYKYKDIRHLVNQIKINLNNCLLIYLQNAESILQVQNQIVLNEKIFFITKQSTGLESGYSYQGHLIQLKDTKQINNFLKQLSNESYKSPSRKPQDTKPFAKSRTFKYYVNKELYYLKDDLLKQYHNLTISTYNNSKELFMNIILTNNSDDRIIIIKKKDQQLFVAQGLQQNLRIDMLEIDKKQSRVNQFAKLIQLLQLHKCIRRSLSDEKKSLSKTKNAFPQSSPRNRILKHKGKNLLSNAKSYASQKIL